MYSSGADKVARRVFFHGWRIGQRVGDHDPSASRGDVSNSDSSGGLRRPGKKARLLADLLLSRNALNPPLAFAAGYPISAHGQPLRSMIPKGRIHMGKTSNQAKQQWNAKNYVQIKISIAPDIAAAFKAKCAVSGVSVASELTRLMGGKPTGNRIQKPAADMYRTRRLRHNGLKLLINHLEFMRDAEQDYLEAIPANLTTSPMHEAAEHTVSALDEALNILCDAF